MIDESILNEILPIPELEELKDEKISEFEAEGFEVNNFKSGGIFYTLLMIIFQVRIEFVKLLRKILNSMFLSHASGSWLDLKAADYSKKRKQAGKTYGYIILSRTAAGEAVKIPKSTIFKTAKSMTGEELRFISVANDVMPKDELQIKVLVEAEKAGAEYNVSSGRITRCLTHLEGIDSIMNDSDWIEVEGNDREDDESLRSRALNAWSELSARPIAAKYKNVCEAVEGVLFVEVDDRHPRGQGTIDIIVTGTAGEATEALLSKVSYAAESIAGEYDNLQIRSSEAVIQDISLVLTLIDDESDEGVVELAKAIIADLMRINKSRKLNELLLIDFTTELKNRISVVKNVKFLSPSDDVLLTNDKVIVLGDITVTIQGA